MCMSELKKNAFWFRDVLVKSYSTIIVVGYILYTVFLTTGTYSVDEQAMIMAILIIKEDGLHHAGR